MNISPLQKERYNYCPKLPNILKKDISNIAIKLGEPTSSVANEAELKEIFKNNFGAPIAHLIEEKNDNASKKINVGVVLSGGQAPGGHNVIFGLFDGIKKGNKDSKLFGFLQGPSGILDDDLVEIDQKLIDEFKNTGGFDIIGSGRTKLETNEQYDRCIEVCKKREIDAIVIIGGDDSNTNAAVLAEYFKDKNSGISVIGCPKTIDGDLKNEYIEASFGFDTATKTYSELIGNIQKDANSSKKYWHFIKLMGRSASHIGLECALQTQPNICIISEEVEANKSTLNEVVNDITQIIKNRAKDGNNFGVALIPEGLIEFIPEMKILIQELNDLIANHSEYFNSLNTFELQSEWVNKNLTKDSSYVFSSLPNNIQRQLLLDRDPHGNVQVSLIETEKLISEMVEAKLDQLKEEGDFNGKFQAQHHFFGYEGRCAFPSNFDADYCYSLGFNAFILIANGLTGYISSIKNLSKGSDNWIAGGIPLTMMMNIEQRHGKQKPVIKKALVELDGKPFKEFKSKRDIWARETSFVYPGAIQYYGAPEVCDITTKTLEIEHS